MAYRSLAIRIDARGVSKVVIRLNGPVTHQQIERVAPYASFGDRNGDYSGKTLPSGEYTVMAVAFDGSGTAIQSATFAFRLSAP